MKPRLLDLFCGAGGAARGYADAGFDVTGVDIKPQPRYPYAFVQADALDYLREHGREYDAIHASPPCQGYSVMRNLPWLKDKKYPLLIDPVRDLLMTTGRPWVIENVMGAKLKAGWLCGLSFGLPFYRHRYFETSFFWLAPAHPRHQATVLPGRLLKGRAAGIVFTTPHRGGRASGTEARPGGRYGGGGWSRPSLAARQQGGNGAQARACGVGHAAGWRDFATVVGIDWMTRDEVCQAIPPAYTHHMGTQLQRYLP